MRPTQSVNGLNETFLKSAGPLDLVFYDVNDPEDKRFWAGTAFYIIGGLRKAGNHVHVIGRLAPRLRRLLIAAFYHSYRLTQKLHYHPDRHLALTKLFSAIGTRRLQKYPSADAIITVSAAFSAYLRTSKPIIVLLDATWGQIVETYPYFHSSMQPKHIVASGFKLDQIAFSKPNLHLVMTSQWAAGRAIVDYNIHPARVHILPFGANFREDPARENVERALRNRSGERCSLLFVGREFERKGGPLAVQIAGELRTFGIDVTLHIVGCSPQNLPSFVKVHGLLSKDSVEHLSLLDTLYSESDFFLMPSTAEAQGIVFNEAAAYALPVAASDVGGVSAVVSNGDWGLLLPPGAEAKEYAVWLAALFRDRPRYIRTALRARDDYEKRLSNTAYTRELTKIVQSIVQAHERPALLKDRSIDRSVRY
ncbi:glycosyltransferase family 4 protein [Granulicella tundricola]|nr:glycosyltransferase family 4 protein [Granulicella tundricola]